MKTLLRLLACSTLASALPLHAQRGAQRSAQRGNERPQIDTTFAFSKSGEINLSLVSGEIRVTAWARDEVRVVASSETGEISSSFSPTRVRLEMRRRSGRTGRGRYDVTVPIGTRVSASAVSGSIDVNGTRSSLSLTTTSGPITASDATGRSEFETVMGRIALQRIDGTTRVSAMTGSATLAEISGDLEIEGVGATTRIERADLSSFRFEAVAGSLDFSGTLAAQGKHTVQTLSGSITLRVPGNFGATLELETLSGELRGADFPLTLRPTSGSDRGRTSDRQEYTINGGGARISIQTFSGSVFLRKIGAPERR
jgi:DUF4097 and DUF4098 domain-containing protein YvlB